MPRAPAVNRGVILPPPLDRFDPTNERETRRLIEEAFRQSTQFATLMSIPPTVVTVAEDMTPLAEALVADSTSAEMRATLDMGALAVRTNLNYATAPLGDGSEETGVLDMPTPCAALLQFSSDAPCRARLYVSADARTADIARDEETRPTAGNGLLAEFVTDLSTLSVPLSPVAMVSNAEAPTQNRVWLAVTNMSGGTAVITLTFLVLPLEIAV